LIQLQKELTELGWGRVMLTVHDSLVFSIKKEFVHEAIPLIRKRMTTPVFETTVPFKVDVTIGPNYGEQEAYDPEKDYVTAA
jgi:DNA polymerase I-like protein with 3'-5' exonuclease and polymerase domains